MCAPGQLCISCYYRGHRLSKSGLVTESNTIIAVLTPMTRCHFDTCDVLYVCVHDNWNCLRHDSNDEQDASIGFGDLELYTLAGVPSVEFLQDCVDSAVCKDKRHLHCKMCDR